MHTRTQTHTQVEWWIDGVFTPPIKKQQKCLH